MATLIYINLYINVSSLQLTTLNKGPKKWYTGIARLLNHWRIVINIFSALSFSVSLSELLIVSSLSLALCHWSWRLKLRRLYHAFLHLMLDHLINAAVVTQSGESYLVSHFAWRPMMITPVNDFLIITAILEIGVSSCTTMLRCLVANLRQASLVLIKLSRERQIFFLQLIPG